MMIAMLTQQPNYCFNSVRIKSSINLRMRQLVIELSLMVDSVQMTALEMETVLTQFVNVMVDSLDQTVAEMIVSELF